MSLVSDLKHVMPAREAAMLGDTNEAAATAAGDASQANAYELTANITNVVTVGATTNSVKLPPIARASNTYYVIRNGNGGGITLNVYPASGEAFSGSSADVGMTLVPGASAIFFKRSATQWIIVRSA